MTAKTIAEAAAELRKLHAEMIEAGDAPGGVYSLKSHMEADVRFIRAAKDNVPALLDALERYEKALREIASIDDKFGNAHLNAGGSYAAFDEPGSVKLARAALEETK